MNKIKLGIVYGGISTEHEVSVKSHTAIRNNLDINKYEIYDIYIDKQGKWYDNDQKEITNIIAYLKNMDVVFPVLHGLYGEDGTIQGLLELINVPYVGSGVLSSSLCMDKAYAKIIFNKAHLLQAKYVYIKKEKEDYILVDDEFNEINSSLEDICTKVSNIISFPSYIKPSNSGSSIGINKANTIEELKKAIEYATSFDNKILVEEEIKGHEIECSVLGNEKPIASLVGEILSEDNFYSYDAKYNSSSINTTLEASISDEMKEEVRTLAIKAYKALDCKGFARVDFFVDDINKKVYINEINTIPGFTEISMYPKLWEKTGVSYNILLDKLISLALERG